MDFRNTRFPNNESLAQILQKAIQTRNLNYYAHALAISRNAQPDPHSVALNLELIETGGPKWLEVLQRQTINDYRLVYKVAFSNKHALQVLVGLADQQQHREELKNLCMRILYQMQSSGQVWSAFYMLLKISLDVSNQKYKFQLLGNVNRLIDSNKLPLLLNNLAAVQQNQQLQHQFDYKSVTFFNIYSILIKFYLKCLRYALRKGMYKTLIISHQALINYLNEIFNNTLVYIETYSIQLRNNNQSVQSTLISASLLALQQLAQLSSLQLPFILNAQALVKALMRLPVLIQGDSIEDRLNFQYGISSGEFGQDLQSLVSQTIYILSLKVPAVFRLILLQIQSNIINQVDTKSIVSGFVLFAVLSKLVMARDDLVAEIATPLLDYILRQMNAQTPIQISCRVLRLLVFYGPIISQKQYKYLLKSSIFLLANQPCNSFGFKQADNIFQLLVENSSQNGRFSSLIEVNLKDTIIALLDVVQQTKSVIEENRQQKAMRVVKLLSMLIKCKQSCVVDLAPKIIKNSMSWLLQEINLAWNKNIKHTVLIFELSKTLKQGLYLMSTEQIFVDDISQELYKLLQLLKYPQRLEIIDQLLQILQIKLSSEEMDSKLCQTLVTSLQSIVKHQNGNLCMISNVLKALNNPKLSTNIIFEWGDLVTYIANLYLNYFSNFNQNHTLFYNEQFNNISSYFQKYLQVYQHYFSDYPQFRNYLLQSIRSLLHSQWRCRFFLVLHHQACTDGYDIFNLEQISYCKKKGTMKLTFFYFIDQLIRNYNQSTLNKLTSFYKIYEQKKIRRELQQQAIEGIPYPDINLRSYLHQGLKELRKKNHLDFVQYNSLIKQFKLS